MRRNERRRLDAGPRAASDVGGAGEAMSAQTESWFQAVRYTAAEPTSWLNAARTLRQAAEDLWVAGNAHAAAPGSELGSQVLVSYRAPGWTAPQTGGSTSDVCFMLFGFALENLAKGIIVCRDSKMVTRRRLGKWHGARHGHDLARLFDLAKISVTDDERGLLVRATRLAVWRGRYPVPMDFYDVTTEHRLIGFLAVTSVWPADVYNGLSGLYKKAAAALIAAM